MTEIVTGNKKIVQENLKKKRSLRNKIGYLWFAYQGAILAIGLSVLFFGGLLFSFVTQKEPGISVRVLSHGISYENVVTQLEKEYDDILTLPKKQIVDVQNFDLEDTKTQDALIAQLAANQIDMLILTQAMDEEMEPLFEKNQIPLGNYVYTDLAGRQFVSRIPPKVPHQKNLMKILE